MAEIDETYMRRRTVSTTLAAIETLQRNTKPVPINIVR